MSPWMIWAHKWLGLAVGLQVVLWVASGLYMTAIPIQTVRGEHNIAKPAPAILSATGLKSLNEILTGPITRAELTDLAGHPVWRLDENGTAGRLIDARTGILLSPLRLEHAHRIAQADFSGQGKIVNEALIEKNPPIEYRGALPVWQITFDDHENTRLYVNAITGKVSARRTDIWRVYDFLWGLHIMDYGARENFNNWLVITVSMLGLLLSLSGLWIVAIRFWPPIRRSTKSIFKRKI